MSPSRSPSPGTCTKPSIVSAEQVERCRSWWVDPAGWCYVASEALYYLVGGKESGLKPMQARIDLDTLEPTILISGRSVSHWWLEDPEGNVIDATSDQFDFPFPYHLGRGRGFQAKMKGDTVELLAYLRS